jgi:hypothetical protein
MRSRVEEVVSWIKSFYGKYGYWIDRRQISKLENGTYVICVTLERRDFRTIKYAVDKAGRMEKIYDSLLP